MSRSQHGVLIRARTPSFRTRLCAFKPSLRWATTSGLRRMAAALPPPTVRGVAVDRRPRLEGGKMDAQTIIKTSGSTNRSGEGPRARSHGVGKAILIRGVPPCPLTLLRVPRGLTWSSSGVMRPVPVEEAVGARKPAVHRAGNLRRRGAGAFQCRCRGGRAQRSAQHTHPGPGRAGGEGRGQPQPSGGRRHAAGTGGPAPGAHDPKGSPGISATAVDNACGAGGFSRRETAPEPADADPAPRCPAPVVI